MVPEDGLDNDLIASIGPFSDSRLAALLAPQSLECPTVSVEVGGMRPHEVARPNTLVTLVADVSCPNSV